jgi:hypothetical protein
MTRQARRAPQRTPTSGSPRSRPSSEPCCSRLRLLREHAASPEFAAIDRPRRRARKCTHPSCRASRMRLRYRLVMAHSSLPTISSVSGSSALRRATTSSPRPRTGGPAVVKLKEAAPQPPTPALSSRRSRSRSGVATATHQPPAHGPAGSRTTDIMGVSGPSPGGAGQENVHGGSDTHLKTLIDAVFQSFEHQRSSQILGAKLGADSDRFQATPGHNHLSSVQLDGSVSHTRRHTAMLRRCLLSSGSRVRVLPGALPDVFPGQRPRAASRSTASRVVC